MNRKKYDCIIVGAGMMGLLLAKALADAGLYIALLEKLPLTTEWTASDLTARVSTLNNSSINILKNLKVWSQFPQASMSPLRELKVWDDLGGGELNFAATQVGKSELGFIVENRAVIKTLWQSLQDVTNVDTHMQNCAQNIRVTEQEVTIQCAEGLSLTAEVLVGADGANSWVRKHMQFSLSERPYQQNAIVAVIGCEHAHQQTAQQSFLPAGPLGVLPLSDTQQCSIVWSNQTSREQQLMQLPVDDFNRELTNALQCRLGNLSLLSQRISLPLIRRHASQYIQPRIALVGDAAHTIHPLAGQGANLGFMDAAALAQVLIAAKQRDKDIGRQRVLRHYERWRKGDNQAMHVLMQAYCDLYAENNTLITSLRSLGMNGLGRMPAIKNYIMRYAMGERMDAPSLVRAL